MRWIEFILERMDRNNIPSLLNYYEDIGWISSSAKPIIMKYSRGAVQNVTAIEPDLDFSMDLYAVDETGDPIPDGRESPEPLQNRSPGDWRLTAEDHLKSLLFIKKLSGNRIDRDELNALEQEIGVMKHSLQGYHGI